MVDYINYKGRNISREEIIQTMDRFDKYARESFPERKWVTYAIEHNGKLYPPKEILRMVTGSDDIPGGGEPINSRYRNLGFRIINLEKNDSDSPSLEEDAFETSISLERDLENALIANLNQLEPGLHLYSEKGSTGQQFDTQTVGRIDILALDKLDNIVVIEIKAGEADDRVCGQIQRYMGWVKDKIAGNRSVRGLIIANQFSERLKYAIMPVNAEISLIKYEVSFKFTDIT